MMTLSRLVFVLWFTCTAVTATAAPRPQPVWNEIDWPAFLSRSDLVWQVLPDRWATGAFTGNGLLGAMTYVDQGALSWELGRADVVDNQPSDSPMVAAPRLPLGFLRWRGCDAPKGDMRLDLWNAELQGSLSTAAAGATKLRSWTHATRNVIGIALGKGGCTGQFEIDAARAVSDRAQGRRSPEGETVANPAAEASSRGTRRYAMQRLARGGAHVIAIDSFDAGSDWITYATVSRARTPRQAMQQADQTLNEARRRGWDQLVEEHRKFWHAYHPQSFVSLPDAQLESFYWIQMYKLASASRANGPIIDTLGPWYHRTPWPGVWWNLNVQLSYWPVYTANRLALGEPLIKGLRKGIEQLRANARPQPGIAIGRTSAQDLRSPLHLVDLVRAEHPDDPREHGNLLWAMHNAWLHDQHAMDPKLHRDVVGMLSEAVAYVVSILRPGKDGLLHVPLALSPEYPKPAVDTNYHLALLKWGLKILLLPQNQSLQTPATLQRWAETSSKLPAFPTNDQGFMIGRDQPLAVSHRHFSHLMMIYPLDLVSPDVPADRAITERSLAHWIGLEGALEGYSFVGASAISSRLGNGDKALGYLSELIRRFVRRNTMYTEAGPVIETPLATAQAVHEMLLQTRDNAVHVFPAMPAQWKDATFRDLRVPGASLVSAERREGRTTLVTIRSLAGQPMRLHLPKGSSLQPVGLPSSRWQQDGPLTFDLRMHRGEVLHFVDEHAPATGGGPVAQPNQVANPFGSRTQNAWLPASVRPGQARALPPRPANDRPGVATWHLLDASVPTVFSDNGAEEIFWAHTSCDPCAGESKSATSVQESSWKPVSTSDGCFDFRRLLPSAPGKDVIAYVRGSFVSQTEGEMDLRIGVNDQGRVWWWSNADRPGPGDSVLVNTGESTMGKNESTVRVRLKKGVNHVFVKTINVGGGWGACVKATLVR